MGGGGLVIAEKQKKQRIEFVEIAASATLSWATGTFVQEEPGVVEMSMGAKQKIMSLSRPTGTFMQSGQEKCLEIRPGNGP